MIRGLSARHCWSLLPAILLLAGAGCTRETPVPAASVGMVDAPCPPSLPMPPAARQVLEDLFITPRILRPTDFDVLTRNEAFVGYDRELRARGASDWAGLCRYHEANQGVTGGGVVFVGDSITENWLLADPAFFSPAQGIHNRGVGAQTSAQMLLRFRSDVVALHPAVVHILAGTNDVAGNNGPVSPGNFRDNIESMVEIAGANGIRVILGSIPPAATFGWQPALLPAPRIAELNLWLQDYAARHALVYVDYHAALGGPDGELLPALGNDGVHPNRDGYARMRPLAEAAIATARRSLPQAAP